MNKDDIKLWVSITMILFSINLIAEAIKYNMAKSYEYCNEDGFWVKTSFSGRPIGIAIDKDGKQITCEYKVEVSK